MQSLKKQKKTSSNNEVKGNELLFYILHSVWDFVFSIIGKFQIWYFSWLASLRSDVNLLKNFEIWCFPWFGQFEIWCFPWEVNLKSSVFLDNSVWDQAFSMISHFEIWRFLWLANLRSGFFLLSQFEIWCFPWLANFKLLVSLIYYIGKQYLMTSKFSF